MPSIALIICSNDIHLRYSYVLDSNVLTIHLLKYGLWCLLLNIACSNWMWWTVTWLLQVELGRWWWPGWVRRSCHSHPTTLWLILFTHGLHHLKVMQSLSSSSSFLGTQFCWTNFHISCFCDVENFLSWFSDWM